MVSASQTTSCGAGNSRLMAGVDSPAGKVYGFRQGVGRWFGGKPFSKVMDVR